MLFPLIFPAPQPNQKFMTKAILQKVVKFLKVQSSKGKHSLDK